MRLSSSYRLGAAWKLAAAMVAKTALVLWLAVETSGTASPPQPDAPVPARSGAQGPSAARGPQPNRRDHGMPGGGESLSLSLSVDPPESSHRATILATELFGETHRRLAEPAPVLAPVDATLGDVLGDVSERTGLRFRFTAGELAESRVTLALTGLSLEETLDLLAAAAACRWTVGEDGTIVWGG